MMYLTIDSECLWQNLEKAFRILLKPEFETPLLELLCINQDLSDPRFFSNYSLMVILIEKIIREMNLDIYRAMEFIFST